MRPTVNSPDQRPQTPTYGKRKRGSQSPSSSWGEDLTEEIMPPIGMQFGNQLSPVRYSTSQPMYEYNITAHYGLSLQTIAHHLLWSDKFSSSVAELGLENLAAHGMKQVFLLILKIREPNFGMVTEINNMLLSMNFEAVSTSPIYSGGSIGTLCLWRSKDLLHHW